MTLAARVGAALGLCCTRARACGLDSAILARLLLELSAGYARSAGWSLTRARAELGALWASEDVAPEARGNEPGGVV